jgi:hypothetical protein
MRPRKRSRKHLRSSTARRHRSRRSAETLGMMFLEEPLLEFGYGQKLVYPRDGLFLFGPPNSTKDVMQVRYGVIGTPDGVRRLRSWASKINRYIPIPPPSPWSRKIEPQHVPFPGFGEAFRCHWPTDPAFTIEDIDTEEIETTLRLANRHEAIHKTVDLFVSRLIHEHNRLENPPAFWFVVIPEIVYELGRPNSAVPKSEQIAGQVQISAGRARELKVQPTLFRSEDDDARVYEYATHFRRQLKARLLKDRIVTQIVRETTLAPEEFIRDSGRPLRRIEDPATIAWKLGTGAFYKAGGKPWQLANVRNGVCYVGLVYKRSDNSADPRHACCAAQMFLTDGDGVVFRGALGPWFHEDSKQFHLDETAAKCLIQMVTEEYKDQHEKKPPAELFIHATSAFTDEEWKGFSTGCDSKTSLVGVQIIDARDDLKLFRPGRYPVIRGSALQTSDRSAYLWTSGYAPRLDTYMGPETPNPLLIRIGRGESSLHIVLKDILGLTKINFNSCLHNDRLPVTIRFANAVGDVLISAPIESEPRLPFKFYI